MIEKLNLVQGEPVTNRARYWLWVALQESEKPVTKLNVPGVSYRTILKFITGGTSMTIERLARLADALGWSFEDLFRITPDERKELDKWLGVLEGDSEE